ncbi:MAG: UDP-N-acetylglucosamine 1-carboxyvinyltransferase, partial [Clostridia bacterium]|nr:UDP-N-acetylglucosamine 1-carboxyvinyltransferase [Clostridia bacterium]
NELIKMGAEIELKNGVIRVFPSVLKGNVVEATDLRAGAALITAALGAYGATEIKNVNYIVRGYERITEKIASIGGKIKII